jgi:hypothetical protein
VTFPQNDLAVINVSGVSTLRPATFGDSDKQEVVSHWDRRNGYPSARAARSSGSVSRVP